MFACARTAADRYEATRINNEPSKKWAGRPTEFADDFVVVYKIKAVDGVLVCGEDNCFQRRNHQAPCSHLFALTDGMCSVVDFDHIHFVPTYAGDLNGTTLFDTVLPNTPSKAELPARGVRITETIKALLDQMPIQQPAPEGTEATVDEGGTQDTDGPIEIDGCTFESFANHAGGNPVEGAACEGSHSENDAHVQAWGPEEGTIGGYALPPQTGSATYTQLKDQWAAVFDRMMAAREIAHEDKTRKPTEDACDTRRRLQKQVCSAVEDMFEEAKSRVEEAEDAAKTLQGMQGNRGKGRAHKIPNRKEGYGCT